MQPPLPLACAAALAVEAVLMPHDRAGSGVSIDVTPALEGRIAVDLRWPAQVALRAGRPGPALTVTRSDSAAAVRCPEPLDRIDLGRPIANGFTVEGVTLRAIGPDRGYENLRPARWRLEAPAMLSTGGARPPASRLILEPPIDRYARRSGYRPPRAAPCRSAYSLRVTLRGPADVDPFGDPRTPRAPGGKRLRPDGTD